MINKNYFLTAVCCIALVFSAFSQSRSFEDVLNLKLRNAGTIKENEEIRGYYFFYSISKAKKGMKTFLLRILDENLDDVNTTTIEENKNITLVDGKYNGKEILLKFFDYKARSAVFMSFDQKAKLLYKTNRRMNKRELLANGLLHEISNKGFVDYGVTDYGKHYQIRFYDENKNVWEVSSKNTKGVDAANYLCSSESAIFSLVNYKPTLRGSKVTFGINSIDMATGKENFNINLSSEYNAQPLFGFYENELVNVMGLYYSPKVKSMKSNGLGMFLYQIDNSGKIVNKKYLAWAEQFSKFVDVDERGMIKNDGKNGFIYFHDIIRTESGEYIAVGEQYQKVADGLGIAATLIFGGNSASTTKVAIRDMVLFHFNKDFSVKNVEFVEKTKSFFFLPPNYDFMNIHLLSQAVKQSGSFDFAFISKNKSEGTNSICYLDYEKLKGEKNKWIFGAITETNGELIKDKIPLTKSSYRDEIRVLQGKPGYVTIVEYDASEKKIDLHLEQINY